VQRQKGLDRATDAPPEGKIRFSSRSLPKWARRSPSLDALLPFLCLRGLSSGDVQEALSALVGSCCAAEPVAGRARGLPASCKQSMTAGNEGTSRPGATSASGLTASVSGPGWSRKPNACWR
jgi:hypothetical protein